ncbi:hypothetical protein ACTFIR_009438 [Dictyostelium discoideum]
MYLPNIYVYPISAFFNVTRMNVFMRLKASKSSFLNASNSKKSVNSSGNNTTGNSSNSKSSSEGNVASGSNNTKSANGTNNHFQKNKK